MVGRGGAQETSVCQMAVVQAAGRIFGKPETYMEAVRRGNPDLNEPFYVMYEVDHFEETVISDKNGGKTVTRVPVYSKMTIGAVLMMMSRWTTGRSENDEGIIEAAYLILDGYYAALGADVFTPVPRETAEKIFEDAYNSCGGGGGS